MHKWPILAAFAAGTAAGALSLGIAHAADPVPVPSSVREVLSLARPPFARGYTLTLLRTTVMPGADLPKHYHPGYQAAYIEAGAIRYTIFRGVARVYHGPADTATTPKVVIRAGHSATLVAGDWLVETPGLVHSAKVISRGPFIALQAGLLKTGRPVAVPVP